MYALTPAFADGFAAAFRDTRTGETHLATGLSGQPSAVHELGGLPAHWVVERDRCGEPTALHPAIVAGYRRFDRFLAIGASVRLPEDA